MDESHLKNLKRKNEELRQKGQYDLMTPILDVEERTGGKVRILTQVKKGDNLDDISDQSTDPEEIEEIINAVQKKMDELEARGIIIDDAANSGNFMIERDAKGKVTNVNIIDVALLKGKGKGDTHDMRKLYIKLRQAALRNEEFGPRKRVSAKDSDDRMKQIAEQSKQRMEETRAKMKKSRADRIKEENERKEAAQKRIEDAKKRDEKRIQDIKKMEENRYNQMSEKEQRMHDYIEACGKAAARGEPKPKKSDYGL